jgi:membrane protease YdiL (CAAX protease family)
MTWMCAFPFWIADRRLARFPHLPRCRAVFVEAGWALLAMVPINVTLIVVFNLLAFFLGDSVITNSPLEPIARSPDRFQRQAFLILVFAIAPVAEEVFFRGMFYNFLRERLHLVVAILIQAVVFALMHPFDLAQRGVVSIIGIGLGVIYEWRKTLLSPMLLHALQNAFWVAILAWNTAGLGDLPRLGVIGKSHDRGCVITEVTPGSAAQAAGLKVGDIITAVDDDPVSGMPRLTRIIRDKKVGDQVSIQFIRHGEAKRVEAVLTTLKE